MMFGYAPRNRAVARKRPACRRWRRAAAKVKSDPIDWIFTRGFRTVRAEWRATPYLRIIPSLVLRLELADGANHVLSNSRSKASSRAVTGRSVESKGGNVATAEFRGLKDVRQYWWLYCLWSRH